MPTFTAYTVSSDGDVQQRVDLICEDEEAAKARAKQLVDGDDVELWQRDKRIAVFLAAP
jgi:hypothetical protein